MEVEDTQKLSTSASYIHEGKTTGVSVTRASFSSSDLIMQEQQDSLEGISDLSVCSLTTVKSFSEEMNSVELQITGENLSISHNAVDVFVPDKELTCGKPFEDLEKSKTAKCSQLKV